MFDRLHKNKGDLMLTEQYTVKHFAMHYADI